MQAELLAKTGSELVDIHNGLNPPKPLNKPWKKSKDELVGIIIDLGYGKDKKTEGRTIRETALDLLCTVDYFEDKTQRSSPDNRVKSDHPEARSVGLPYLTIIDEIKAQFPDAQTSVACLRWYAVKVRAEEFGYEGYRLAQRRPRAKPVK